MPESFFEARPKDSAKNDTAPNDQEILAMFPIPPPRSERAATFIARYDHGGHWANQNKPDGLVSDMELYNARYGTIKEDRLLGEQLAMSYGTVKTLNNDETGLENFVSKEDLTKFLRLQDLSANSAHRLSKKLEDLPQADREQAGRILDSLLIRDYASYRSAIRFFDGKPEASRVLKTVAEELREVTSKATGRNRVKILVGSQEIAVEGQKDSLSGSELCLTVTTEGETANHQYNYRRLSGDLSNKSIFEILSMRVAHAVLETADK